MISESDWHFPDDSSIAALAQAPKIVIARGEPDVWGPSYFARQFCVLMFENRQRFTARVVLDVGSGSGVLAVMAAKLGAAKVVAIDAFKTALNLTEKNAKRNGVDHTIICKESRFLEFASSANLSEMDIIVCNHFSPTSSLSEVEQKNMKFGAPDVWRGAQRELLFEVLNAIAGERKRPITLFTHVCEEQGVKSALTSILDLGLVYETLLTVPMAVNRELFKQYIDDWGRSGVARIRGEDVVRDVVFLRIENFNLEPKP
jgi:SAM-dependent methyltransferase